MTPLLEAMVWPGLVIVPRWAMRFDINFDWKFEHAVGLRKTQTEKPALDMATIGQLLTLALEQLTSLMCMLHVADGSAI